MIPFYAFNLQAKYNKKMDLPFINGATDGCFSVGLMLLYTCLYGRPGWEEGRVLFGHFYAWKEIIVKSFIIISLVAVSFVYLSIKNHREENGKKFLFNMLFLFFILFCSYVPLYLHPSIKLTHYREIAMTLGYNFSYCVAKIHLSHISDSTLHVVAQTPTAIIVA